MNYREYREEIERIAADAVQESEEYHTDLEDTLHQMIDGHEYVIYTHNAYKVREHTQNWDSYHDVYGDKVEGDHIDQIVVQYAYFAMCADVREEVSRAHDMVEEVPEFGINARGIKINSLHRRAAALLCGTTEEEVTERNNVIKVTTEIVNVDGDNEIVSRYFVPKDQ